MSAFIKRKCRLYDNTVFKSRDALKHCCNVAVVTDVVCASSVNWNGCCWSYHLNRSRFICELYVHDLHIRFNRRKICDCSFKSVFCRFACHSLPHESGCDAALILIFSELLVFFFSRSTNCRPDALAVNINPNISYASVVMQINFAHRFKKKSILI